MKDCEFPSLSLNKCKYSLLQFQPGVQLHDVSSQNAVCRSWCTFYFHRFLRSKHFPRNRNFMKLIVRKRLLIEYFHPCRQTLMLINFPDFVLAWANLKLVWSLWKLVSWRHVESQAQCQLTAFRTYFGVYLPFYKHYLRSWICKLHLKTNRIVESLWIMRECVKHSFWRNSGGNDVPNPANQVRMHASGEKFVTFSRSMSVELFYSDVTFLLRQRRSLSKQTKFGFCHVSALSCEAQDFKSSEN